jgi:hypothetical protein
VARFPAPTRVERGDQHKRGDSQPECPLGGQDVPGRLGGITARDETFDGGEVGEPGQHRDQQNTDSGHHGWLAQGRLRCRRGIKINVCHDSSFSEMLRDALTASGVRVRNRYSVGCTASDQLSGEGDPAPELGLTS